MGAAGQKGESIFPVLAFMLYYCCFQQTCLAGGAGGGAANNGCSHFPAVRYLTTLTAQPSGFYLFSLWHRQLKCCQQSAHPKSWPRLLAFTSQGTPLCQASSKGSACSWEGKCQAAEVRWGLFLSLGSCKCTATRWMCGREVSP